MYHRQLPRQIGFCPFDPWLPVQGPRACLVNQSIHKFSDGSIVTQNPVNNLQYPHIAASTSGCLYAICASSTKNTTFSPPSDRATQKFSTVEYICVRVNDHLIERRSHCAQSARLRPDTFSMILLLVKSAWANDT